MTPYLLSKIANIVNGKLYGTDCIISNVFIDSRNSVNNSSLFFALVGERHNGHQYISDLCKQGIQAFVVSQLPINYEKYTNVGFVLVNNTLDALQQFASKHLQQFSCPVIGITGSNGKTIVKEWIAQLLQGEKKIVRSPKSYNSQVGVPLSVLLTQSDDELAVFEAGISKPGEMARLEKIIHPAIGIITNIGEAHQENFLNINEKLEEKLKLFTHSQTLIYCSDSALIDLKIKALYDKLTLFTWGEIGNPTLKIEKKVNRITSTDVFLRYNDSSFTVSIPFSDVASIENALHSISLLLLLGYSLDYITEKIQLLTPIAMRLELKEGVNNCTIINDSYNSDINSLTIALDFLSGLSQHNHKTLILSDILQSGKDEATLYNEVVALVRDKKVTRLIGIGPSLAKYAHLFDVEKEFFIDTDEFLRNLKREKFSNESILLKGSRSFKFERISRVLEKKIHETVLEVNLNALVDNLNHFKAMLKPTTKIMAMVKAFSYGSGSYEIASLLQFNKVDYLAVAFADEGVALREAGISMPIIVLNAEPGSFDTMINYQLEPEIYSTSSLKHFADLVARKGIMQYPIHIKLDTGMHRLGFIEHDISNLIVLLKQSNQVKISSIFTHLAASDELVHNDFTRQQIKTFDNLSGIILNGVGYKAIRHVLNSAGIERFPEAQFDMVRLGIGLYGVSSNNNRLRTISTLRSTIVQIKEVNEGETVGYGRRGKVEVNKRIATIPIGYADGLNRKFSNGVGYFMVNGKAAPIIGNVCMDTCMIDITGIDASEGDNVIIFGERPTVAEMAQKIGTIPYEILTSISQRVKRIYVSD